MTAVRMLILVGLLSLTNVTAGMADCKPGVIEIGFPYGTLDGVGGNFKERERVKIILYNDDTLLHIPIVMSQVTDTGVRISPDQYVGYEDERFDGVIVFRSKGVNFYADRSEDPLQPMKCVRSWSHREVQPYTGDED